MKAEENRGQKYERMRKRRMQLTRVLVHGDVAWIRKERNLLT
jgi:hypothetical protein